MAAVMSLRDNPGRVSEMLEALLSSGAEPNALDSSGEHVLSVLLSKYGTYTVAGDCVKMLMSHGSDPAKAGLTDGTFFGRHKDVHIGNGFSGLVDGGFPPSTPLDGDGLTILDIAARLPYSSAMVKSLLDAGADPNRAHNGLTPVIALVDSGHGDASGLSILLDAGADPDFRGPGGRTALHLAAATGQIGIARVLVDKGANVTIPDSTGMTAASVAVSKAESSSGSNFKETADFLSKIAGVAGSDGRIEAVEARLDRMERLATREASRRLFSELCDRLGFVPDALCVSALADGSCDVESIISSAVSSAGAKASMFEPETLLDALDCLDAADAAPVPDKSAKRKPGG